MKDRAALWLVRLAKLGRQRFRQRHEYEFYENFFDDKDQQAYRQDPRMVVRRNVIGSFVAQNVRAGARVVDVGCGLGDMLASLDSKYTRIGVEMAASSARVAAKRLDGEALVVRGSANALPWASEALDACICLEVLEHLEDDDAAVRELYRVLRPGGWLIASVPYTYYWEEYLDLIGHYRHYTRRSFQQLLQRAGFVVERYLPNYPEWHQEFTRWYAVIRGLHLLTKRLLRSETVYELRWPRSEQTMLEIVRRRLEPKRLREENKDYAGADTSTFVAARKPTVSHTFTIEQ